MPYLPRKISLAPHCAAPRFNSFNSFLKARSNRVGLQAAIGLSDRFISASRPSLFESFNAPSTLLLDSPRDVGVGDAARRIVDFHTDLPKGKRLPVKDLVSFSRTTSDNQVDLLMDREVVREGILEVINDATESIHIASLILRGAEVGERITTALINRKKEYPNLQVRVILDAVASRALVPGTFAAGFVNRLREAGIEVTLNYAWNTGLEHRKMVVVDSKVAVCGPAYWSDEAFGSEGYWEDVKEASKVDPGVTDRIFIPKAEGGGESFPLDLDAKLPTSHDYAFRFTGSSVLDLQASFLQSWLHHGNRLDEGLGEEELLNKYFPSRDSCVNDSGNVAVKLSHGVPFGISEMRENMLSVVGAAKESLELEIAYVVIPEFIEAVIEAADRGVKVRFLVNSEKGTNIGPTWYFLRNYYPRLVGHSNIEMREFNSFTHAKIMVADRRVVFGSTGNPEYNSWERGFDEIMLIDDKCVAEEVMSRLLEPDMSDILSTRVLPPDLNSMPLWKKAWIKVVKVVYDTALSPTAPEKDVLPMVKH